MNKNPEKITMEEIKKKINEFIIEIPTSSTLPEYRLIGHWDNIAKEIYKLIYN